MFRKSSILLLALLVVSLAAGCASSGPAPSPVPPTKTPKPTFTPTPDWTPTSIAFPTLAPTTAPVAVATEAPAQPTAELTESAPTAEPAATTPAETRLTASQTVNVRGGPGTAYPALGRLSPGQSFVVTGRNDAGDWVKFDFNGKDGWVTAALVSVAGDLNGVEVAQAPAIPTPRPQPTARPRPAQPTAAPQPTSPPAPPPSAYKYPRASVVACRPQAGGTWFDGYIKMGGQPVDGDFVVFSWAPDAAPIASIQAGPHTGYPGWNHGYFSHIIAPAYPPKAGDWWVWVVDSSGKQISEKVKWTSVGQAEGCNDASLLFEG